MYAETTHNPFQQSRHQALRSYCPDIYTVIQIHIYPAAAIVADRQLRVNQDVWADKRQERWWARRCAALAAAISMGAYDDFSIMYRLSPISEICSFLSIAW